MTTLALFDYTPREDFRFDGDTYEPAHDKARLSTQMERVKLLMSDGGWRTLQEISDAVDGTEASVSARLRDLRKERFGSFVVALRARGDRANGLHEYRVLPPGSDGGPVRNPEKRTLEEFNAELKAENARLRELVAQLVGGP